jgi:hypothetical protein
MEDAERGVDGADGLDGFVRPAERSGVDDALGLVDLEIGDSSSRRIPSELTL